MEPKWGVHCRERLLKENTHGRALVPANARSIPRIVGEQRVRMHWWCIRLPVLSSGSKRADGFREGEEGYWQRDRQDLLANSVALQWLDTENWDAEEVTARGRLDASLRDRRVLIIGAGSLGSAIAELLVRGGVRELVLLDRSVRTCQTPCASRPSG